MAKEKSAVKKKKQYVITLLFIKDTVNPEGVTHSYTMTTDLVEAYSKEEAFGKYYGEKKYSFSNFNLCDYTGVEINNI